MRLRTATPADIEALLPCVADFHAHERLSTTPAGRQDAIERLLREPARGRIVLAEHEVLAGGGMAGLHILGYGIVVFGYSIEFGGIDAFVDELYVVPSHRGRGIGTRILAGLEDAAKAGGSLCAHLEVDVDNAGALELYARLGYKAHQRHLMTKRL